GALNAGRSTPANTMVGAKASIVSRKVQTTRTLVRAIAVEGASQLVFIDTPGIFAPRRRLDRAMVESAWSGAADADIVALLIDAANGLDEPAERILQRLKGIPAPAVLVLNKIDRVKKERLLELAHACNLRVPFAATFMICAVTGDGVGDFKSHLARTVTPGPWHYPADAISDAPMRLLAAEITREKIFERLHEELPYEATVETTSWQEQPRCVRIEQTIFVERDGQKAIVLGARGGMIRQISIEARGELTQILEKTVPLSLFAKVRENWANAPERYRDRGLTSPKD